MPGWSRDRLERRCKGRAPVQLKVPKTLNTPLVTTALIAAVLGLSACGKGGTASTAAAPASGEEGRFAGLDAEIQAWRLDILANHKICTGKTGDMACQDFAVACKGERELTTEDGQKGVTAKIVSAMTFNGKGSNADDLKPGSSFVEFAKTGETWTRTETAPVNLQTCAAS